MAARPSVLSIMTLLVYMQFHWAGAHVAGGCVALHKGSVVMLIYPWGRATKLLMHGSMIVNTNLVQ